MVQLTGRLPGLTAVVMNSSVPRDWVGPEFHNAVGIPDRAYTGIVVLVTVAIMTLLKLVSALRSRFVIG